MVSQLDIPINGLNNCLSQLYSIFPRDAKGDDTISILGQRLTAKILAAQGRALRPFLMRVLGRECSEAYVPEKTMRDAIACIQTLEHSARALRKIKGDKLVAYT